MTDGLFTQLFRTDIPARDNFRARVFAIFSEEIVRIWSQNERSPYRDIGRPTLWDGKSFATLDFTLERQADGARFVSEQKAEMTWAGYGQLRLDSAEKVESHRGKRAFDWFLDTARDPSGRLVKVKGKPIEVQGAILVWGAIEPIGRTQAMTTYGFADVLSIESMVADLNVWCDARWQARVDELDTWSSELFHGLTFIAGSREDRFTWHDGDIEIHTPAPGVPPVESQVSGG